MEETGQKVHVPHPQTNGFPSTYPSCTPCISQTILPETSHNMTLEVPNSELGGRLDFSQSVKRDGGSRMWVSLICLDIFLYTIFLWFSYRVRNHGCALLPASHLIIPKYKNHSRNACKFIARLLREPQSDHQNPHSSRMQESG